MILVGDVMDMLATLPADHVDCVVTSPPYWGLRDYGVTGQLGLEKTPQEYVGNMRMVFEQVRRVLKPEGTLWLNLGDSYARNGGTQDGGNRKLMNMAGKQKRMLRVPKHSKLKEKDLAGIPWSVAFALRDDGWYLRQDIIWHKPNPMPESVTDRCTKAHEYIFLFAKNKKYHFANEALFEDAIEVQRAGKTRGRGETPLTAMKGDRTNSGGFTPRMRRSGNKERKQRPGADTLGIGAQAGSIPWEFKPVRNKRSVWTVTTRPFKGAHFATFPPKLIEPCILAGCPVGGTVLDPFFGAGTVGVVAKQHGRNYIGIELNPEYAKMAERRINGEQV